MQGFNHKVGVEIFYLLHNFAGQNKIKPQRSLAHGTHHICCVKMISDGLYYQPDLTCMVELSNHTRNIFTPEAHSNSKSNIPLTELL